MLTSIFTFVNLATSDFRVSDLRRIHSTALLNKHLTNLSTSTDVSVYQSLGTSVSLEGRPYSLHNNGRVQHHSDSPVVTTQKNKQMNTTISFYLKKKVPQQNLPCIDQAQFDKAILRSINISHQRNKRDARSTAKNRLEKFNNSALIHYQISKSFQTFK